MDFSYTEEDDAFRAELRSWLDENLPEFVGAGEIHVEGLSRTMARRREWQKRLNEGRWAAINWPKEWGGREATIMQNVIYSEEMAKARAPGIFNANGIWQIGPMIIRWGTDEQKQKWLPGILSADEQTAAGNRLRGPAPTCGPRRADRMGPSAPTWPVCPQGAGASPGW